MHQVVRWLVLGVIFAATCLLAVQPFREASIVELTPRLEENLSRNSFVANADQLCRPFVSSENPQVVRVVSLLGIPGDKPDTVIVKSQTCSGVVIGPRTVLTAKHCVEDDDGVMGNVIAGFVKTLSGETYPIRLRSPDANDDIMMVTVSEPMGIQPAEISPRLVLSPALTLEGYGCLQESSPLPLQRPATRRYAIDTTLYISGCVCHGDSGGPVFDPQGRLVAVMVRTDNEGLAGRGQLVHNFLNVP